MINFISSNIRIRIILVFFSIILSSPSVALVVTCDRKTGAHPNMSNPKHFNSSFPKTYQIDTNRLIKETKSNKLEPTRGQFEYWREKGKKLYITKVWEDYRRRGLKHTQLGRLQSNGVLYREIRLVTPVGEGHQISNTNVTRVQPK